MRFHQQPNVYVNHVHLLISDLSRSVTFYTNILGFNILERNERRATLTTDGKTALITLEQPKNVLPKAQRTTGLYHFAILVPDRPALARVLLHLLRNNYPLQGASDHLVSEAVYLADPDGNGIEIYVDRPAETWKWEDDQVLMATLPLDVDSLLAEAGVEAFTILPRQTILGHLHLHVADLEAAKEFYCGGLGFDVVSHYGDQALFISYGGYHHHIGLNIWNGIGAPEPPRNSVGLKWYTLRFPDEATRTLAIERLQSIGAEVGKLGSEHFTKDPSGNLIKLTTEPNAYIFDA